MKKLSFLITLIILFSCSSEKYNATIKGEIKGLKKGVVYLQKFEDTLTVNIDSIEIKGNSTFELQHNIDAPEVYSLLLDKNDNIDSRIIFFADKGITEINSTLKNFVYDAKINGCKQQETLDEFLKIKSKFNNKNLEIIEDRINAQIEDDSVKFNQNEKEYKSLLKRKYLYTVNFAINNKDSEVAPFLALTEIYDANITLLDTINNSLTAEVKASKYGKKLQDFIDKIKKNEGND